MLYLFLCLQVLKNVLKISYMKNLKVINPYSDTTLIWNNECERYELKTQFVKSEFVNNFVDDGVLEKRIKKNSRVVYTYILAHCNSMNLRAVKKALNYTEEGRNFLKSVLMSQMEADIENGYNDITLMPSINAQTSRVIKRDDILNNQVSVETEEIIKDTNVAFFGFNLMYAGVFPITIFTMLGVDYI